MPKIKEVCYLQLFARQQQNQQNAGSLSRSFLEIKNLRFNFLVFVIFHISSLSIKKKKPEKVSIGVNLFDRT